MRFTEIQSGYEWNRLKLGSKYANSQNKLTIRQLILNEAVVNVLHVERRLFVATLPFHPNWEWTDVRDIETCAR